MDLKICGIVDIVIILVAIILMVVGYKKGFIKKLISLAGILVIVVFSVMFCGQFAEFMKHHGIFYPSINESICNNIIGNFEEKGIEITVLSVSEALEQGLNVPKFFADIICNGIENGSAELPAIEAAGRISEYLSSIVMTIIAFFILLIGTFLIVLILKLVADALRTNKLIKFVDGVLGMIFYLAVYAVIICVLFYALSIFIDQEWFTPAREWLNVDMMLEDDSKFRISKAIYESNILKRILDLFI